MLAQGSTSNASKFDGERELKLRPSLSRNHENCRRVSTPLAEVVCILVKGAAVDSGEIVAKRNSGKFTTSLGERKFGDVGSEPRERLNLVLYRPNRTGA